MKLCFPGTIQPSQPPWNLYWFRKMNLVLVSPKKIWAINFLHFITSFLLPQILYCLFFLSPLRRGLLHFLFIFFSCQCFITHRMNQKSPSDSSFPKHIQFFSFFKCISIRAVSLVGSLASLWNCTAAEAYRSSKSLSLPQLFFFYKILHTLILFIFRSFRIPEYYFSCSPNPLQHVSSLTVRSSVIKYKTVKIK